MTTSLGYLENLYLNDPYLTEQVWNTGGMRCRFEILNQTPIGMRTRGTIVDYQTPIAMRTRGTIVDQQTPIGMRSRGTVADQLIPVGMRTSGTIADHQVPIGARARGMIVDQQSPQGMRSSQQILPQTGMGMRAAQHIIDKQVPVGGRYSGNILDFVASYGVRTQGFILTQTARGIRAKSIILNATTPLGMRAHAGIVSIPKVMGEKALATKLVHLINGTYLVAPYLTDSYLVAQILAIEGMRTRATIADTKKNMGMRAQMNIIDHQKPAGMRAKKIIKDFLRSVAMRAISVQNLPLGMSAFVQIYNTDNLRILSVFASRGSSTTGSTNAWGNGTGLGLNWLANSTEAGDFDVANLNTDIDEQVWRSATGITSSVVLKNDVEVPQGIFLDTLSIRNHNLTSSAVVTLEGSTSSTFASVDVSAVLTVLPENIYYIAPEAPMHGYRYWRLTFDDPSNPDGFIKVGTILFGRADCFQGESMIDSIDFAYHEFADSIPTEGFTNVANSRALKKVVNLSFQSLRFQLSNFKILRNISTTWRTTHKLLWIPTPDPVDMLATSRFAVYGKLSTVPKETHNWKGANADYVSLAVEIDESK